MLVRNRHRELVEQLGDGWKDRRRVGELREHHEPDRQERRAPRDCRVDHREHAVGVRAHLTPVERVGEIGLAGGGGVADR